MGWAWADHSLEAGSTSEHHHTGNADAGGATNGTNQIGELCAVLEALRAHPGSEPLTIETDSQYAINCSTTWIHGWKKNGWKNSKNEPVKNADLIRAIDAELTKREGSVKFVWVKGHAGNAGNEKVDTLARTYAEDCRSGAKSGYLPLEGWKSLLSSPYASGTDVPQDAKDLMENKISCEDYHIGRAVGEDTNPDFAKNSSVRDASKIAENTEESVKTEETENKASEQDSIEQNHNNLEKDSKQENNLNNKPQPVQGLSVSGVLQFTPPPNTSPTFDGQPRFISGTINISGYVQPDGTLHFAPTAFYLS